MKFKHLKDKNKNLLIDAICTSFNILPSILTTEHFEMVMINSTPLALLDVCEVCGSYQCPYCPAYSSAWSLHIQATSGYFVVWLSLWFTLLILHVQNLK